MPTILRWKGYRFYFFSNEGFEPPHVHVDKIGHTAKFWLEPVALAKQHGFSPYELQELSAKITAERAAFLEAWERYFA